MRSPFKFCRARVHTRYGRRRSNMLADRGTPFPLLALADIADCAPPLDAHQFERVRG